MSRQFTIPHAALLPPLSTKEPERLYTFEAFLAEWLLSQCLAEGFALGECDAALAIEQATRGKAAGETITLPEDTWAAAVRVAKSALDKKLGQVNAAFIPFVLRHYHVLASAQQRLSEEK